MTSTATPLLIDHPDHEILAPLERAIRERLGGDPGEAFVEGVLEAIEYVLDSVRTGRTRISELEKNEKSHVGLKVEHFIRDALDVPKGKRDLIINGQNVDVKNTVGRDSWMIPRESYRDEEVVLLVTSDPKKMTSAIGLMVARVAYLNGDNGDKKRGISAFGRRNIWWLARDLPWPKSRWADFDMVAFRELRVVRGGSKRAEKFFLQNLRKRVHRKVLLSLLHDQKDPMKRLRENGGARDRLKPAGILLLSGKYDRKMLSKYNLDLGPDEFIALHRSDH